MYQEPQHEADTLNLIEEKMGNRLEYRKGLSEQDTSSMCIKINN